MDTVLVIAGTFLLCWLIDKGFTKLFRGKPQHASGKSVRLNKFYGLGGIVLCIVGVAAALTGISQGLMLLVGGILVLPLGIFLSVYYLSFGIFYDEDSFILSSFGKKSVTCRYGEIENQQLYNVSGKIVIELYLKDGTAVQLHSSMLGVYPFLDTAFSGWCRQRGIQPEDCDFHDPDNSCWFPGVED